MVGCGFEMMRLMVGLVMSDGPVKKICATCGKGFECGALSGRCWCAELPRVLEVKDEKGCRCPECCRKMIEGRLGERKGKEGR